MWVVCGLFDDTPGAKRVLETGTTVGCGRREGIDLFVNNKRVSKEHCEFVVSKWDSAKIDERPVVEIINRRADKSLPVRHLNGVTIDVSPSEPLELEDGDEIFLTTTLPVTVHWVRLCCYANPLHSQVNANRCTAKGVGVTAVLDKSVTHHLCTELRLTAPMIASLLNLTTFAKPSWLKELLAATDMPAEIPPPITSMHEPALSDELPEEYRQHSVWSGNEQRSKLIEGFRFVFLSEEGRVDKDWIDLTKLGYGSYEGFSVSSGAEAFKKSLSRAMRKENSDNVVVVAERDDVVAAVGEDDWNALLDEVSSAGAYLTSKRRIFDAVLQVDTSILLASPSKADYIKLAGTTKAAPPVSAKSAKPTEAPTPAPAESREGSQPPASRKLVRRGQTKTSTVTPDATPAASETPAGPSEAPTPDSSAPAETPAPAAPVGRRPLVRRRPKEPTPEPVEITPAALPARRPLKRRLPQNNDEPTDIPKPPSRGAAPVRQTEEPALKKFKALFEASDPRAAAGASGDIYSQTQDAAMQAAGEPPSTGTESQTQTQSRATGTTQGRDILSIVREEEEEASFGFTPTQLRADVGEGSSSGTRGTKRKATEDDLEVDGVPKPASKRRTIDSRNGSSAGDPAPARAPTSRLGGSQSQAATSRPPDSAQSQASIKARATGAAPGDPDTDQQFLEALASKRRGKKGEDLLDKEFNQLKITKPNIQQQQTQNQQQQQQVEEEWNVMGGLLEGLDLQDPRGNFMVIQEMEVYRRPTSSDQAESTRWAGKANFKKFRKKGTPLGEHDANAGKKRRIVELVISDEQTGDLGTGPAYWKDSKKKKTKENSGASQEEGSQNAMDVTNGEFDEEMASVPTLPTLPSSRSTSRAGSLAPGRKASAKCKGRAIVINDSDDPDDSIIAPTDPLQRKKPASKAKAKAKAKTSKATPLFILSDNEDEQGEEEEEEEQSTQATTTTRRSTRATGSRTTAKKPAVLDDSDDGLPSQNARRSKRTTAAPRKATVLDDDDSDDGAFKGFGARRRPR